MKFCMECGTELPDRAKFCSNCGLQLTDQAAVSWSDDQDDQEPDHVPELHEPPVPAAPPFDPHAGSAPDPEPEPAFPPVVAAPMATAHDSAHDEPVTTPPQTWTEERDEPPVPVARYGFREPYAADEPLTVSTALPWEQEEREDLVPPPASAYAPDDASAPLDLAEPPAAIPAPAPSYQSYVVDEPPPPFGDGIDVPNAPPDPSATEVTTVATQTKRPNWIMRHKLVAATTAVVSAVIVAAAVNSAGDTPTTSPTTRTSLSPVQPTVQPSQPPAATDQNVAVGAPANIGGMQATVLQASPVASVDETHNEGYLVADVRYVNLAGGSKPYGSSEWQVQLPSGALMDAEAFGTDGQLSAGDLAPQADVSGKVTFKIGTDKGEFKIVWKPTEADPARALWSVTVS